ERLEVVPVVLDLGAFGDAIPESGEDVLQLALDLRDEMEMATGTTVAPHAQVEPRTLAGFSLRRNDPVTATLEDLTYCRLVRCDRLARGAPVACGQVLDRFGHDGGRRPPPDIAAIEVCEVVEPCGCVRGLCRLALGFVEKPLRVVEVHSAARRCRTASK